MVMKSAEVSDSAMLQREAMVLNNFHACPYIYRCFGEEIMTGYCNCIIYNILLKYGSGGTLADLIKKSGGRALLESESGSLYNKVVSISSSVGIEYVAKVDDFGLAKTEKQMRKMMTMSKSYKLRGYFRCLSP
ncbi:uncharacterized protein LOC114292533 [Camellia sinensis]|uniref:uncharacterized protein LOC114292533 n=1 Tax=Camellia sinensis TaxID=4442 RepID=UPI00103641CF|nr:uncharacterized protein LOC114292533 [Camellia sinensis]